MVKIKTGGEKGGGNLNKIKKKGVHVGRFYFAYSSKMVSSWFAHF
jgi:hypothetical protein